MDRLEFLKSVLSDEGYYCIFGIGKKNVQKFYDNIEAAETAANEMCANNLDTYFALSTFENGSSRCSYNSLQLKSLFLDLDCGEGKPYKTQSEAVQALKNFCKESGMPRPTMVNSGGGIHVYWPFEEPVNSDDWWPIANQLKKACVTHDLKADASVTSDRARILRVPGTFNFKTDNPREVKVVSVGSPHSFDFIKGVLGEPLSSARKYFKQGELDETTKAILGNHIKTFRLILQKSLEGRGCAHIAYIYESQESMPEPLWRAGLSIAKFCDDADEGIRIISEKYPEFDEEYTHKKVSNIVGPIRCETLCSNMAEHGRGDVCKSCPFWGTITSPIVLGKEVAEATAEDNIVHAKPEGSAEDVEFVYEIPAAPYPYFRGKNGGIYKRVEKDDQTFEVLVYHNDIYVHNRLNEKNVGDCAVIRLHLPKDGVREFTIPMTAVSSTDEFRKNLYANGVVAPKIDEIKNYILESVGAMQNQAKANVAHRQFGWVGDKFDAFIIGDKKVRLGTVDGETTAIIEYNPPTTITGPLFPALQKKGSFEEWREAMEFYNRPGMEQHQFAIGLSFGSVFTAFTPVNAGILHIYSPESGLGKTTSMIAGASVWGDPTHLILKDSDTMNSKMLRAEVMKNLPIFIDEVTNASPMDLSTFAYNYTSGMQKNRMASSVNQERVRGEIWKQMAISSGNTSITEKIRAFKSMPAGEMMRILDTRATKVSGLDKVETDKLSLRLINNYGHAGVPFLEYIITNIDYVKATYFETQRKLDAKLGFSAQERFYSVMVANAMVGLMIAKQLGLVGFDLKNLRMWMGITMGKILDNVRDIVIDPQQTISMYWMENSDHTLGIKSGSDLRKGDEVGSTITIPAIVPKNGFTIRYEYDTKELFICRADLRKWCASKNIPYEGLIDGLKEKPTYAKVVKKRMGKGTHHNFAPVDVLRLTCDWVDYAAPNEDIVQEDGGEAVS